MALTPTTQTVAYSEIRRLYMAIELAGAGWRIAASDGTARISEKVISPGDAQGLLQWVQKMRKRFGLPEDAPVLSCYEAGRDAFWVHRFLESLGIQNVVIDPASLKVDRRARRAKSDRIDARQMLADLLRYYNGEPKVFRVARIPSVEDEDNRRLHRNLQRLKKERTQHRARICSLLATQGVRSKKPGQLPKDFDAVQIWDGSPLLPGLRGELERERERLALVQDQIRRLQKERRTRVRAADTEALKKVELLTRLGGIGLDSAWLLVMEFFAWREFRSRRDVAGAAGLGGTPYSTGATSREQGISKAGNPRVRARLVELAWLWLRHQPHSRLTQWYRRRFAAGGSRMRRVGIVALSRRLLIELWHFVEHSVVPPGAKARLLK